MTEFSIYIALGIGAFSTLHCLGMCSGIIGALSFSLPAEIQHNRRKLLPFLISYNLGRITSYSVAGLLIGGLSTNIFSIVSPRIGHFILETSAGVVLLFIGFHLAGWFPKLIRLELIGRPIWRRIEPYGRKLLPVKTPFQAYSFGLVWGWLPCGLVYTTLLWSASSGSSLQSGMLMLAFGIGTLPTTLFAGMLANWIANLSKSMKLRKIAGSSLIIIAFVSLYFTLAKDAHKLLHI